MEVMDLANIADATYLHTRNTKTNLDSNNGVYLEGQRVEETDTGSTKTGDGTTAYTDLPYDYGYQRLESGSLSTSGWYTIAEIDETENVGSGIISMQDENGNNR